jgi:hypothetical protein
MYSACARKIDVVRSLRARLVSPKVLRALFLAHTSRDHFHSHRVASPTATQNSQTRAALTGTIVRTSRPGLMQLTCISCNRRALTVSAKSQTNALSSRLLQARSAKSTLPDSYRFQDQMHAKQMSVSPNLPQHERRRAEKRREKRIDR